MVSTTSSIGIPSKPLNKVLKVDVLYKRSSISDRILRIIEVRANLLNMVAATHRARVAYVGSRVLKRIDQHSSIPKKP